MTEDAYGGRVRTRTPDLMGGPGGRTAVDRGCTCSVLANAAYRSGAPGELPFVEPHCPVHATAP
jgi:hypothetical protein